MKGQTSGDFLALASKILGCFLLLALFSGGLIYGGGFMKWNFDGSSFRNPCLVIVGGLVRDRSSIRWKVMNLRSNSP